MQGVETSAALTVQSLEPYSCKECGSSKLREVLREQISDREIVARYQCNLCQAEHLRFVTGILFKEKRSAKAA
jgi:hypothetical protein